MLTVTIESREREVYGHPAGRVVAENLDDLLTELSDDEGVLVIWEEGVLTVYRCQTVLRLSGLTPEVLITPDDAGL